MPSKMKEHRIPIYDHEKEREDDIWDILCDTQNPRHLKKRKKLALFKNCLLLFISFAMGMHKEPKFMDFDHHSTAAYIVCMIICCVASSILDCLSSHGISFLVNGAQSFCIYKCCY
ncbi:hypothetical protein TNCT_456061 [Trichonephila clavata]|uniref:Uncharacterized protein n=1 Tax=Trichonephila clavata TaxID=2740835 RepID=A0A8X6L2L0_TRICU|nr:hypothetical protein TNCT_456061 [Trichonephila clavata]